MRDQVVAVMLKVFRSVEQRDDRAFSEVAHPELELLWPPVLPYGGTFRARDAVAREVPTWGMTWDPLQPTGRERRLDPRLVAANDDEAVVLWHQRGVDAAGERFDGEVLGLYRIRDGRLVRGQMFYFDPCGARDFLSRARR
jgi:ketosteroid isomerase-like protein